MSLRVRLIVAFFLLSVVPLAAVTIYTYTNNVEALREAAEREADLLAGELGQRMQLVTAQLSERVEHLMDVAELQAAADEAAAQAAEIAASRPVQTAPAATTVPAPSLSDELARSLGEAAMLLNNVELHGLRSIRMPLSRSSAGEPSPTRQGGTGDTRFEFRSGRSSSSQTGRGGTRTAPPPRPGLPGPVPSVPPPPATPKPDAPSTSVRQAVPGAPTAPPAPAGPTDSSKIAVVTRDQGDRLTIDMTPIRREIVRQILPDGKLESLTAEERQRVANEINQRMLGVVKGIQVGALELQRRAEEAKREAAAQAQAVQTAQAAAGAKAKDTAPRQGAATRPAAPTSTAPKTAAPELQRRTSFSGTKLGVKVERNGQVVREVNAEVNVPNVLATAFSTTRRDGGEVPFAVAKDGKIYTRSEADRARVESFGAVATPDGPDSARLPSWIVVTTRDPSGSGLKLGIARPVGDSLASLRRAAARNAGFGLLFIGLALAGIAPLSSRLTRNLTRLGDGVRRIASGDYSARVPVTTRDEVGRLAMAFNQMAEDVERHQRSAVEQERIRRELELGRQIQNEMLPHAPLRRGLTEIKGVSVPAREVGGDFFNYFELGDGRIALLVGDVSGKGVGAALLMANIQASLHTRLALGQDLSSLADELDRDIEMNSPGPVYATLFVGTLDPVSRRLQYVNAGHHPQFVLRKSGGLDRMAATGLPVGMFAGRGYAQRELQLAAGDVLFFYTDGCVEVEDESGVDLFGAERLEAVLTGQPATGSDDVLGRVEAAIRAFRGSREPFDDATMMVVALG